ncbi:MAG TPA: hypothetical protein VKH61_14510 [Streptosporangiaceae bacterium]|nr:hypothetical protein [Streptosporangiaceae bacterium]
MTPFGSVMQVRINAALATAPPYRGSQAARGLVGEVAGYLGTDVGPVPYPLALGPAAAS